MNVIVPAGAAGGASTSVPPARLAATISPAVPPLGLDGVQGVMLLDEGLVDILPNVAALLGFAAIFFTLGLWRFRFVDQGKPLPGRAPGLPLSYGRFEAEEVSHAC
jgi:hypothetical protein